MAKISNQRLWSGPLVISQLFVLCFYGLLPCQGISLFLSQTLSVSLHRYLIDPSTLQLVSSIMRNAKEVAAKASWLARNSSGRAPALNKIFSFWFALLIGSDRLCAVASLGPVLLMIILRRAFDRFSLSDILSVWGPILRDTGAF